MLLSLGRLERPLPAPPPVSRVAKGCLKINLSHHGPSMPGYKTFIIYFNLTMIVTLILISLLNRLKAIAGHKNLHTACILYKDYRYIKISEIFFPYMYFR